MFSAVDDFAPIDGKPKRPNQDALLSQLGGPAPAPVSAPGMAAPVDPMPTPAKPDYSQWGNFKAEGLDGDKIARGHDSPKYQIARVLSHFDPKQGLTDDALGALNGLGIGQFSKQNDRLKVSGNFDPRFQDVLEADVIRNMGGDDTAWQGWGGVGAAPAQAQGSAPPMGGMPLDPSLGGDPLAAIQAAIAGYANQKPNMNALLQQLGQ